MSHLIYKLISHEKRWHLCGQPVEGEKNSKESHSDSHCYQLMEIKATLPEMQQQLRK